MVKAEEELQQQQTTETFFTKIRNMSATEGTVQHPEKFLALLIHLYLSLMRYLFQPYI